MHETIHALSEYERANVYENIDDNNTCDLTNF